MVTSQISTSQRILVLVALVSAGLLAGLGVRAILHRRDARLFKTPFRIGFYNTPIEHFPGAYNKPAGNSVDLMNEAARVRVSPNLMTAPAANSAPN